MIRGRGRPRKDRDERRDRKVTVCLTEEEYSNLKVLAFHFDMSKTECIRKLIDDSYEKEEAWLIEADRNYRYL